LTISTKSSILQRNFPAGDISPEIPPKLRYERDKDLPQGSLP